MSSTTGRSVKAKRYYVGPFFAANLAAAAGAAIAGLRSPGRRAAWAAAALTHAAVVAHAPRGWPRRTSGPASLLGAALVGTALTSTLPGSKRPTLATAVAALGGTVGYLGWYTTYDHHTRPSVEVGSPLPDVEFERPDGTTLAASDLAGTPAALFFTRGNWCPFCVAQIQTVVAGYHELTANGVRVVVVSAQPPEESHALAARFGVNIDWVIDPGLRASSTLGIADEGGVPFGIPPKYGTDTIMPTLIVTGADRTVLGVVTTDSFRTRPDPSTVLDLLEQAGAQR